MLFNVVSLSLSPLHTSSLKHLLISTKGSLGRHTPSATSSTRTKPESSQNGCYSFREGGLLHQVEGAHRAIPYVQLVPSIHPTDITASIFLVNIDNVSSQQLHMIRQALRGKGVVLMGKNTMVRRALRVILPDFPQFERLLPYVRGNIGFVFTGADLKEIREIILANKVAAPARAGALAPVNVSVPAGNTGMEPGKTSFFQALGIPTKIARGTIEIVNDVQVVTANTRVGTSEATLLNMLNISPFTYGMTVVQVYDNGAVFPSSVLDIEEKTLLDQFMSGIKTIAAVSLATGIPTIASVSHSLVNSYKNILGLSLATDYEFEGSAKVSLSGIACVVHSALLDVTYTENSYRRLA
jgi:large subunit ribosomal protein LP0